MAPDLVLLQQYAETRDDEALAELIERHRHHVYATCLRILGNRADAEDAAQECFLKLVRHAGQVRTSLAGWLHRCATHTALNTRKQLGARRRRERNYGEARDARVRDRRDPWRAVEPHFDEALAKLPPECGYIVVESYLRQRSRTEIAEELGISRVTLYRRLEQGVTLLRRHLERAGVAVSLGILAALMARRTADARAPAGLAERIRRAVGNLAADGPPPGAGADAPGGPAPWTDPPRTPRTAAGFVVGGILTALLILGVVHQVTTGRVPDPAEAGRAAPADRAGRALWSTARPGRPAPAAAGRRAEFADAVAEAIAAAPAPEPLDPPADAGGAKAADSTWVPFWITPGKSGGGGSRRRAAVGAGKAGGPPAAKAPGRDPWPFAPKAVVDQRLAAVHAASAARRADEEARRLAEPPRRRRRRPDGVRFSVFNGTVSGGRVIRKSRTDVSGPFPLKVGGPRPGNARLGR